MQILIKHLKSIDHIYPKKKGELIIFIKEYIPKGKYPKGRYINIWLNIASQLMILGVEEHLSLLSKINMWNECVLLKCKNSNTILENQDRRTWKKYS